MRGRSTPYKHHEFNIPFISHFFGYHTSFLLKQWIDLNYKIIKNRSKLHFLKTCKLNNIFPKHLENINTDLFNFFHHNSHKKLIGLMHKHRLKILNIEIFDTHRLIDHLVKQLHLNNGFLSNKLPGEIWNSIKKHHQKSFRSFHYKKWGEHRKKFSWLKESVLLKTINNIKPIKFCYFTDMNKNFKTIEFQTVNFNKYDNSTTVSIDPLDFTLQAKRYSLDKTNNSWFLNLTTHDIPVEVSNLLQLGENFSLPSHLNKNKAIHEFIKELESNTNKHTVNNQIKIRNFAVPQFHKFLHNKIHTNFIDRNLVRLYNSTLKFCQENPNIIFTRADKGNVTVALTKEFYTTKIEDTLKDKNTYLLVKKNPAKKIEKDLNSFLKRWLKKEYITKKDYYSLFSSDSILPKAYGLPKIHKDNIPFRIIVSSINTALHSMGTYLHKILIDSLPKSDKHVNNSFDLCIELTNKTVGDDNKLVSFDVTSLFTNIPPDLVVNGIRNRWNHIEVNTLIPLDEFIAMMELILSSTFFTFNNKIYKQIFGVPMGSPLSPILADIVMQDLENSILNTIDFRLPFYYRYVDDILLAIPEDRIFEILEFFNNYHDRLNFTVEIEMNSSLSFLDMRVIRKDNKIITDWYQKKTFSGRFLSFLSNHPLQHKIGTLYGLVDRAILLSHSDFWEKNLIKTINILLDNGFPIDLIFKSINSRLKYFITKKLNCRDNNYNNVSEESNGQKKVYITLPYIKSISESIASIIDKSACSTAYKCLNKLNRFIKVHKDKNDLYNNNNVVYRIGCKDCDASYVGQTKRQLGTRLKEHKNNIKLDQSGHSVVSQHILQYNHSLEWDKVKILDREKNYNKRLISEMLHIKEQSNGINLNKDTESLGDVYFDILNDIAISYPH